MRLRVKIGLIILILLVVGGIVFFLYSSAQKPVIEYSQESISNALDTLSKADDSAPNSNASSISQSYTEKKDYMYHNIDGLYFISSDQYDDLKKAITNYLKSIAKTNTVDITFINKIETENDIQYTFWIRLTDNTFIRGVYDYDRNQYAFVVETDETIINEYIDLPT